LVRPVSLVSVVKFFLAVLACVGHFLAEIETFCSNGRIFMSRRLDKKKWIPYLMKYFSPVFEICWYAWWAKHLDLRLHLLWVCLDWNLICLCVLRCTLWRASSKIHETRTRVVEADMSRWGPSRWRTHEIKIWLIN
jgi:hypothetical protein